MDTYLTVREIAEMLKISYDTALDLVKYSELEAVQIGRQFRVSAQKLNNFLYPPKTTPKKLNTRPIYKIEDRSKR